MYHIIGSDGRQYGPATLEQLQRWMAEGRVNGRTLVQPADSGAWKALDEWIRALPPPLPPHGSVEDEARMGWLRRHFRRHERRSPGNYLFRVTLETFLVCIVVALGAWAIGLPDWEVTDFDPFAVSAIVVAPVLETLLLQMLPVAIARYCGAQRAGQLLASLVAFALLHFLVSPATGIAAGIVGGFYLAFTYTHWRRRSSGMAFLMTAAQHTIHNTAGVLLLRIFM